MHYTKDKLRFDVTCCDQTTLPSSRRRSRGLASPAGTEAARLFCAPFDRWRKLSHFIGGLRGCSFFVFFASLFCFLRALSFDLTKRLQCSETTERHGAARIVHLGWSIYSSGLNLLASFRSLRGSVVRNPRNLSGFNFFFSDRLSRLRRFFTRALLFVSLFYLCRLRFVSGASDFRCVVLTRLNGIVCC